MHLAFQTKQANAGASNQPDTATPPVFYFRVLHGFLHRSMDGAALRPVPAVVRSIWAATGARPPGV